MEPMRNRIAEALRRPPEELKRLLPTLLDETGEYGIAETLEEVPDLLFQITRRLIELDAAELFSQMPEAPEKFMDLLWEGVGVLAKKSEEFRSILTKSRPMTVNFDASDSPLKGHFKVTQGELSGGSGLIPFADQDFRYLGSTEVLLKFLNSELGLGSSSPSLLTEGPPGFAPLISPVLQGISKLISGK